MDLTYARVQDFNDVLVGLLWLQPRFIHQPASN